MTSGAYNFDTQSVHRIADAVNIVENMPAQRARAPQRQPSVDRLMAVSLGGTNDANGNPLPPGCYLANAYPSGATGISSSGNRLADLFQSPFGQCIFINTVEQRGTDAIGRWIGNDTNGTPLVIGTLGELPSKVVHITGTSDYKSGFYEGYYLDVTGSILTSVTVQNAAECQFINAAAPPVHLLNTDIGPAGNVHVGVLSPQAPDNTNRALVTIDSDSLGTPDAGVVLTEWARGDGPGGSLEVIIRNRLGGTGVASLQWDGFGHFYYVAIVG